MTCAHSLFFIGVLRPEQLRGNWWYLLEFDTIAPDDKSAEAYTVEELTAIGEEQ